MSNEYKRPREEAIEKIENYILEKGLNEHDRLPSERDMCKMWGFNRITLRSGIKQLVLEGKLYSKTGSGIFVAPEKLVRNLQDTAGLYETAEKVGRNIKSTIIEVVLCDTTKILGKKMKLPLGHKLLKIVRVRHLDDIPVIIETTYLDAQRFVGLEDYDFTTLSLYKVLKENFSIEITEGTEKISIAYCDEQEAGYLGIEQGSPVIYQSGITIDNTGQILEYFKSITRSEYISFASELTRK